jgi:hypothetical protein
LLEQLDGSNAYTKYCEDSLNCAEDQSGVHGCQFEYSMTVTMAAIRCEIDPFTTGRCICRDSFHSLPIIARVERVGKLVNL